MDDGPDRLVGVRLRTVDGTEVDLVDLLDVPRVIAIPRYYG